VLVARAGLVWRPAADRWIRVLVARRVGRRLGSGLGAGKNGSGAGGPTRSEICRDAAATDAASGCWLLGDAGPRSGSCDNVPIQPLDPTRW